jgi:VPDSG-CTERM motif
MRKSFFSNVLHAIKQNNSTTWHRACFESSQAGTQHNYQRQQQMTPIKKLHTLLAAGATSCALLASAHGLPLPIGGLIPAAVEADPTGGTLVDSLASPFVGTPGPNFITGTVYSAVISGDPSNALGGLTFIYQIVSGAGSASNLHRLTIEGFDSISVDASQNLGLPAIVGLAAAGFVDGTTDWDTIDRSVSGDVVGGNLLFPGVPPGVTSEILVLQTSATNYTRNTANVIDGSTGTTSVLSPQVPDGGAAIGLLGMALMGLEGLRRKLGIAIG